MKSLKKWSVVFFFFIILPSFIWGQNRGCITKDYVDYHIQQNPNALTKINELNDITQEMGFFLHQDDAPLIIPVVVHVVYKNDDENISDAQIQSQIDILNQDYRKLNSDVNQAPPLFADDVADCNIEFVLAQYDPNGYVTTGITRTETQVNEFNHNDDFVKKDNSGGKNAWDTKKYLNIWVCDLAGNGLGYSPYPGVVTSDLDGVVIDYEAFGNTGTATAPYNKGRTATHEIGHWLNLIHIWGDDEEDENGDYCTLDDKVSDTPQQAIMNLNCPTFPHPSCDNESDMFMNYMDYVNDGCMYMFTEGQKERMQSALFVFRSELRPTISAYPAVFNNLTENGGTLTFQIKNSNEYNNVNWTIQNSSQWINVSPTSGTNNATVTVTYSANNSGEDRATSIVIQASDEYNSSTTVFFHQISNTPKHYVNLKNFFPHINIGLQTGDVGLLRFGEWDMRKTNTDFEVSYNQSITAKFMEKNLYVSKFYKVINWPTNETVSYQNYSLNLPYSPEYRAIFRSVTSGSLTNIYPEIGSVQKQLSSGSSGIGFKDPWLPDLDTEYGLRNRGQDAVFHYQDFQYDLSEESTHKGIFLDQLDDYYYTVRIPATQIVQANSKEYKFYNYKNELFNSTLTTPENYQDGFIQSKVVFTGANPTITNYYKGTQLSSSSNAYSNNNQRKIIHDRYTNTLVSVYESMERVWIEGSSDNGKTWSLLNHGKPLNENSNASSPSVARVKDGNIAVVYQEENKIILKILALGLPLYQNPVIFESIVHTLPTEEYDASPLISVQKNFTNNSLLFLIIWDDSDTQYGGFSSPGLHYRILERNSSGDYNFLNYAGIIPNTDENSLNPTLDSDYYTLYPKQEFHLAWQQILPKSEVIKYYKLKMNYNNNSLEFLEYYEPSAGGGYSKNYNPSITTINNGTPRLSWIGYRRGDRLEKTGKIDGDVFPSTTTETRALLRYRASDGAWYGTFYKFGSEVNCVNIASIDDIDKKYILGWTASNSVPFSNNYIVGSSTPILNFGTDGKYLQVSNSSDVSRLWGNSFSDENVPYSFTTSYNGVLQKPESLPNNIGREGIVRKESAEFYFIFGDVKLNNEPIEFEELTDSLYISTSDKLNRNLITKGFEISSNSNLTFSVSFGVTDSSFNKNDFKDSESVNFQVELIDYKTKESLGVYNKVKYNNTYFEKSKSIAYQINAKGIEKKTVQLRLVIKDDLEEAKYSIAELHSDKNILSKTNFQTLTINQGAKVEEYSINQNFPNPFNPSTTITFALPQKGEVVLKVYNSLGQEVKTLVNEFKEKGIHKVNFDASNLPSGVYIYSIQANDFMQSKKMILLK